MRPKRITDPSPRGGRNVHHARDGGPGPASAGPAPAEPDVQSASDRQGAPEGLAWCPVPALPDGVRQPMGPAPVPAPRDAYGRRYPGAPPRDGRSEVRPVSKSGPGYLEEGAGSWLVIASTAGAAYHPAWLYNLAKQPEATIEFEDGRRIPGPGRDPRRTRARSRVGAHRDGRPRVRGLPVQDRSRYPGPSVAPALTRPEPDRGAHRRPGTPPAPPRRSRRVTCYDRPTSHPARPCHGRVSAEIPS
jgi:hypothetical protein